MKYLIIFLEVFNFIFTPTIFKNFVLYFLPAEARAPSETRGEGERNRLWWNLLEKVRTFYQQNPDVD